MSDVLSKPQTEALLLIGEHGPLSESNQTSALNLTIYWMVARKLVEKGLIMELDKDQHMRPRFALTPEGEIVVAAASKNADLFIRPELSDGEA